MNYYTNCPECTTILDLDVAIEAETSSPYLSEELVVILGEELCVEVECPKCKVTVTVDCEATFEFTPNIY